MRRDAVAQRLRDKLGRGGYLFPDYGRYCFVGVPGTCLSFLDARPEGVPTIPADTYLDVGHEDVTTVLFVLIDGFGYNSWCRITDDERCETNLLTRFEDRGIVTPITSLFPSETAAALPSVHTGQYPAEHGLLGWWQYVSGVGRVQTLPYLTEEGQPVREAFPNAPRPEEVLYEAESLYTRVPSDVQTVLFRPTEFADPREGGYDAGADTYVGYDTVPELAIHLRREFDHESRQYLFVYLPQVDELSHSAGPEAESTEDKLESILDTLSQEFIDRVEPDYAGDTLVVLSADHGHIDTAGYKTLNENETLHTALAEGADGNLIPPVGSARQLQLHLQHDQIAAVQASLSHDLDCLTFTQSEYTSQNLFGPTECSPVFEQNAPDLLCVHRNKGMWFGGETLHHVGMHGGLSPEEMLVPFAIANLDALR